VTQAARFSARSTRARSPPRDHAVDAEGGQQDAGGEDARPDGDDSLDDHPDDRDHLDADAGAYLGCSAAVNVGGRSCPKALTGCAHLSLSSYFLSRSGATARSLTHEYMVI